MIILIGSPNETTRIQLKDTLEQLGHPTLVVASMVPLKNLKQAGYHIDVIICEHQLEDCKGTDIIAEVGVTTPTIVFGAKGRILNRLLQNRCFPNTIFSTESIESPSAWPTIISMLESHKKNVTPEKAST